MKFNQIVVKDNNIACSFCGKRQHEVSKMVCDRTEKVFICDECIEVCHKLASAEPQPAK
jgi:ATP-dependent Clp protease ATP-binding subunit ClpX